MSYAIVPAGDSQKGEVEIHCPAGSEPLIPRKDSGFSDAPMTDYGSNRQSSCSTGGCEPPINELVGARRKPSYYFDRCFYDDESEEEFPYEERRVVVAYQDSEMGSNIELFSPPRESEDQPGEFDDDRVVFDDEHRLIIEEDEPEHGAGCPCCDCKSCCTIS